MIPLACFLLMITQPPTVVIATPRGETIVPLTLERGSAAVAAPLLSGPLGLTVALEGSRATVILAGATFVFQLGAPFVRAGGVVYGLVGEPYLTRDTLFLPCIGSPTACRGRSGRAITGIRRLADSRSFPSREPSPRRPPPPHPLRPPSPPSPPRPRQPVAPPRCPIRSPVCATTMRS